jgi:electron transport complex protein RnfB
MPLDVYGKLADRLDAIPNGFDRTESGVELRLLAKLFTEGEARLASVMRLSFERPSVIAERAGVVAEGAGQTLEAMAQRGLVRSQESAAGNVFGLIPFVIGIYEYSLPRMDEELASLFEEYYRETHGGAMTHSEPAVHRIIPVGESIPIDLEIFPYERALEYIETARSWGVRDCICRVQQRLVGKGCDHPTENCIVFAPVEGAFADSGSTRVILRDEAVEILRAAAAAGLVHSTMNQQGQIFYICNCCTCCCGILRGVSEFGIPSAVARSDFRVVVDGDACTGCGVCVERCQFKALSEVGGTCDAEAARCVGCGVCVPSCPSGALRMERRPEGEVAEPPSGFRAWLTQRAAARGISLSDIE